MGVFWRQSVPRKHPLSLKKHPFETPGIVSFVSSLSPSERNKNMCTHTHERLHANVRCLRCDLCGKDIVQCIVHSVWISI